MLNRRERRASVRHAVGLPSAVRALNPSVPPRSCRARVRPQLWRARHPEGRRERHLGRAGPRQLLRGRSRPGLALDAAERHVHQRQRDGRPLGHPVGRRRIVDLHLRQRPAAVHRHLLRRRRQRQRRGQRRHPSLKHIRRCPPATSGRSPWVPHHYKQNIKHTKLQRRAIHTIYDSAHDTHTTNKQQSKTTAHTKHNITH